jgi:tRNA-specific 2-thiouridylase
LALSTQPSTVITLNVKTSFDPRSQKISIVWVYITACVILPPSQCQILTDEHNWVGLQTLGQREGLGIGGVRNAPEEPWFVAAKDMEKNVLYAVQGHDHPALLRSQLTAGQLSWISGASPHTHWVYAAKPRYRTSDQPCEIDALGEGRAEIAFAQPQWAVTPGQSVVLYESLVCLGGGIIVV